MHFARRRVQLTVHAVVTHHQIPRRIRADQLYALADPACRGDRRVDRLVQKMAVDLHGGEKPEVPGQLLEFHPGERADELRLLRLKADVAQRPLLVPAVQRDDVIEQVQAQVDLLGLGLGASQRDGVLGDQAVALLQDFEL